MVISLYGQITFKHFQDNPTWAAAAGYDFNYFDCLSVACIATTNVANNIIDEFLDFPDYQVRELPAFFVKVSVATALLFILLFAYPLLAVFVYVRCKHSQKKYSGEHTDITSQNMRVWLRRCQEKWGRRHG